MIKPLPQKVLEEIEKHCGSGRQEWQDGDIQNAEVNFLRAWELIPNPPESYDYAQDLAWGILEFYRDTAQFSKAIAWLDTVCKTYQKRPENDASLGFLAASVYFRSEDFDRAYALFDDLYQQYGRRPFEGEKAEYLAFYKKEAAARHTRGDLDGTE